MALTNLLGAPGALSAALNRTAASATSLSPTASSITATAWRFESEDGASSSRTSTITNHLHARCYRCADFFCASAVASVDRPALPLASSNASSFRTSSRSGTLGSKISSDHLAAFPAIDIEDLKLSNIHIEHLGGGTVPNKQPSRFLKKRPPIPTPRCSGTTPSQGIYFRHIKGPRRKRYQDNFREARRSARSSFSAMSRDADFFHIKAPGAPAGAHLRRFLK